jgi:hypothetical protein
MNEEINKEREAREEWLKTLKAGDCVCYRDTYTGYKKILIKKILSSGKIRLMNDDLTDKFGYVKGQGWGSGYSINPITSEINDFFLKKNLLNVISHYNMDNKTIDQLERILLILTEPVKSNLVKDSLNK